MNPPVHYQLSKKYLDRLVCSDSWNSLAYYCDQHGNVVTAQDMADPSYVPCVKVNFTIASGRFGFFVAHLSNKKIYWLCDRKQRVHLPARKTKPLIRKLFKIRFEIYENIDNFTKFALPLIRRTFPQQISNALISPQPMSSPASLAFYTKMVYGSKNGPVVSR